MPFDRENEGTPIRCANRVAKVRMPNVPLHQASRSRGAFLFFRRRRSPSRPSPRNRQGVPARRERPVCCAMAGAPASAEQRPVFVHLVEHLAAGLRDQHQVLHPHAELPGQVDPRLDGKDHPRLGHGSVGAAHVALLVVGAADEVPQPVGEVRPVPGLRDQVPGGFVQVAQPHAGAHQGLGGFVVLINLKLGLWRSRARALIM